jgi:tetratricopeptide (TPR) repeat protein
VIIRNHMMNKFAMAACALCLLSLPANAAVPKAPGAGQQQGQQPSYTLPEYNAEQAAAAEKDPQGKIKLLDAFVAQYPNSTLMQYIDQFYYTAYYQLKNYGKAIEYADKLIALGDKADLPVRVQAIQARIQLFSLAFDPKAADARDQLTKQRDAALLGVKLFPDLRKVPNSTVTDDQVKAGIA